MASEKTVLGHIVTNFKILKAACVFTQKQVTVYPGAIFLPKFREAVVCLFAMNHRQTHNGSMRGLLLQEDPAIS